MNNRMLIGIICALLSAHYASTVLRLTKLEDKHDALKDQVTASALEVAKAATVTATAATVLAQRTLTDERGKDKR